MGNLAFRVYTLGGRALRQPQDFTGALGGLYPGEGSPVRALYRRLEGLEFRL